MQQRVEELTKSRAGAVDSHGAELRRIERDLHDGTQAQLVSLAMRIGIAKQTMADDPEKAAKLLDDARDGAEQAMNELRGVLRTMYPPILADRGLDGAVSALCARCPLPVELRLGELGQVPAPSRGRCVLRRRGVAHQRDEAQCGRACRRTDGAAWF